MLEKLGTGKVDASKFYIQNTTSSLFVAVFYLYSQIAADDVEEDDDGSCESWVESFDCDFAGEFMAARNPIQDLLGNTNTADITDYEFVCLFKRLKVIKSGKLDLKRFKYPIPTKTRQYDESIGGRRFPQ